VCGWARRKLALFTRQLSQVLAPLVGINILRALTPRDNGEGENKRMERSYSHRLACLDGHFFLILEDKLGSGSGGADSFVEILGHFIALSGSTLCLRRILASFWKWLDLASLFRSPHAPMKTTFV